MKKTLIGAAAVGCLLSTVTFAEDERRDFYAEPGHNANKSTLGQDVTENIDAFSGNISLSYVDISLPGEGGLDINIRRTYNVPQGSPSYANPFGYGWTMHYGRLTMPSEFSGQLCSGGIFATAGNDTSDNPSIEFPDGGRELLVNSAVLDGTFITKSNWKAECVDSDNDDNSAGIVATAPDGTRYYMEHMSFMQGDEGVPPPFVRTWYTTKIVDVFENQIDIEYLDIANGTSLLTRIASSDGREVDFVYWDDSTNAVATASSTKARLYRITSNDATWEYVLEDLNGSSTQSWGNHQHYKMTEVKRPDGSSWKYEYGTTGTTDDAWFRRLTAVRYPTGGRLEYSYQWLVPYASMTEHRIAAIHSKTQKTDGTAVSGTWSYTFDPASTDPSVYDETDPWVAFLFTPLDKTTISTPDGEERVYHIGYGSIAGKPGLLYTIGHLIRHEYRDNAGILVKHKAPKIQTRVVSEEDNVGGILPDVFDSQFKVLVPSSEYEEYYDENETPVSSARIDYEVLDDWGNPTRTTEFTQWRGGKNKITETSYRNDTDNWFIGLPEDTDIVYDGQFQARHRKVYHENTGKIRWETQYRDKPDHKLTTSYGYTARGDRNRVTSPRGFQTLHYNPYRGVARRVIFPDEPLEDGVQPEITRVVNPTGTIASETSARGHTTSFQYDGLNRLTKIVYPKGLPVDIQWNVVDGVLVSKTLTRGNYIETITWDGFGRDTSVVRSTPQHTYSNYMAYDAQGRMFFQTDVNPTGFEDAVWTEYDTLGRVIRKTFQDGTQKLISHPNHFTEIHTDENQNETVYLYDHIGLTRGGLRAILQEDDSGPETINYGTLIDRDILGNMVTVVQGSFSITGADYTAISGGGDAWDYEYYPNHFLKSVNATSQNLIEYGRDKSGNMTWKKIWKDASTENLIASYTYDERDRLTHIDYGDPNQPMEQIDVTRRYDRDGNLRSVSNAFGARTSYYDDNGNLDQEDIVIKDVSQEGLIDETHYTIDYEINDYDNIASITYPSGRTIHYQPDVLGRPTQALPYILPNGITYEDNGALKQITYANGVVTDYTRTDRHWLDTIKVTKSLLGDYVDLDYGYDAAGNVNSIVDNRLTGTLSRTMGYDDLNRLTSTTGSWGDSTFSYDLAHNITSKTDVTEVGTRELDFTYFDMRLHKLTYSDSGLQQRRFFDFDIFGNIINSDDFFYEEDLTPDSSPELVIVERKYEFDYAGNLIEAERITGGIDAALQSGHFSAEYDGANNRVRKINHSKDNLATEFIYSGSGLLFGEYDVRGYDDEDVVPFGHEYFYLGSMMIASAKANAPAVINVQTDAEVAWIDNSISIPTDSFDPDGAVQTISWQQVSTPAIPYQVSADGTTLSFNPAGLGVEVGDQFVFQFTATDDEGLDETRDIVVTITPDYTRPPQAITDQDTYYAPAGVSVELNGSASTAFYGPLSFHWEDLTTGAPIADPESATITVTAGAAEERIYQLTATDAQGLPSTKNVTVIWYSPDADSDGDSLPDVWEFQYFGDATSADPASDLDRDGKINADEYADQTDPHVADSGLLITTVPGDQSMRVVWTPLAGADRYVVYGTSTPQEQGSWVQVADTEHRYAVHSALVNNIAQHYRVEAYAGASLVDSFVARGVPVELTFEAINLPEDINSCYPGCPTPADLTGQRHMSVNQRGDIAIVQGTANYSTNQAIYLWHYSIFSGWSERITIGLAYDGLARQGVGPFRYRPLRDSVAIRSAIDEDGNIAVFWLSDESDTADFYRGNFVYKPFQQPPQEQLILEEDKLYRSFSNMKFDDSGSVHLCGDKKHLSSNRYYGYWNRIDPDYSVEEAFVGSPDDFARDFDCDISPSGTVVVTWYRSRLMVDMFDGTENWSAFPGHIVPSTSSCCYKADIEDVVISDAGEAIVAWTQTDRDNDGYLTGLTKVMAAAFSVPNATYELLPELGWSADDVQRITGEVALEMDLDGNALIAWGDKYATRAANYASWGASSDLAESIDNPTFDNLVALNTDGSVFNLTRSYAASSPLHVRTNRHQSVVDGRWSTQVADSTSTTLKQPVWIMPSFSGLGIGWADQSDNLYLAKQTATGPVAVVSAPVQAEEGSTVSLTATDSYSSGASITGYHWAQKMPLESPYDEPISILDANSETASFVVPSGAHGYWLELTVTDSNSRTHTKEVFIQGTVEP